MADTAHRATIAPYSDHAQNLGWFQFHFAQDRWTWSPQVERMHGYEPGTTAPSSLLVLSHVHPDDDRLVAAALYDVRRTHLPFTSYHRIIDTNHQVHDVVMIGVPFCDPRGAVIGLHGFYLDATAAAASATSTSMYRRSADRWRDLALKGLRRDERRAQIRAATRC